MKFLQKSRETSKEPPKATIERSSRKRRQERAHDEQISNFFKTKRHALSECDPNVRCSKIGKNQNIVEHQIRHKPHIRHKAAAEQDPVTSLPCASLNQIEEDSTRIQHALSSVETGWEKSLPDINNRKGHSFGTSYFTWTASPDQRASFMSGPMPPSSIHEISQLPKGTAKKEATYPDASRSFSRGKRHSKPILEPTAGQEAITGYRNDQSAGEELSETKLRSHQNATDTKSSGTGKMQDDVNAPSMTNVFNEPIMHGASQGSSSCISHLLHECEAAFSKPASIQFRAHSGHDKTSERPRVEKLKLPEEGTVECQKQSRPQSGSTKPLLQKAHPYEDDYENHSRSESRPLARTTSARRAVSFGEDVVHESSYYEHDFIDSVERYQNDGACFEDSNWAEDDGTYNEVMVDRDGFVATDMTGEGQRATEEESMFVRFWKPNKLY